MSTLEGILKDRARGNRTLIRQAPTRDIAIGLKMRAQLLDVAAGAAKRGNVSLASALASTSDGDRYALDRFRNITVESALGLPATFGGGGFGALGFPSLNPAHYIAKAVNFVTDIAGSAVGAAKSVAKTVTSAAIDVTKFALTNPILNPITLIPGIGQPFKNMINTGVDFAGKLAIAPFNIVSDTTSWGLKTVGRESMGLANEIGMIATDPWKELKKAPGALLQFNAYTLIARGATEIGAVSLKATDIQPLVAVGGALQTADDAAYRGGMWAQKNPVKTLIGEAAAVAIVLTAGAAAGAFGAGAAGAAAAAGGFAASALVPVALTMGAKAVMGGGGGGSGGPSGPGDGTTPYGPPVAPGFVPPPIQPPGPIDKIGEFLGKLPKPVLFGGVALAGVAFYFAMSPPASPMPSLAPPVAVSGLSRRRRRRPAARKRRKVRR